MMKVQLSARLTKGGTVADGAPISSVRYRLDAWMSRHNPQLQGEADGKRENLDKDKYGTILYEQRLVESFEKEMRLIDQEFAEKEAELYTAFQSNFSKLKTQREVSESLNTETHKEDAGIKIDPFILKAAYTTGFIALSLLDFYLLAPLIDSLVLQIAIAFVLSMVILATTFFTGNLLYDHYGRRWLLSSMAMLVAGILGIFTLILYQAAFELKACATVLMNAVLSLLLLVLTFLAHDLKKIRPPQPEKSESDDPARELSRIAAERRNNLEYYTKLQAVFVEAAHELVSIYRWSLQRSGSNDQGKGLVGAPFPELKTVALRLTDESGMAPFLVTSST
jgi:hypothetical protein